MRTLAFIIGGLLPAISFASEDGKVEDVVAMLCSAEFISLHTDGPCEKIKHNEKNIVSGKWWKSPVRELKGFDGITGRTQFYSKNQKSTTGSVYHTVVVNGKKFRSSHKLERSGNFNGGTWKRLN